MTEAKNFGWIKDLDGLKKLVDKMMTLDRPYGFDVETGYDGPDRLRGALAIATDDQFVCGFSLSGDPTWARYVPVRHDFAPNLPEQETWDIVRPLLENGWGVAHHAKFEKRNLRKVDIDFRPRGCSMLQAYVLSDWKGVALKHLTEEVLGYSQPELVSLYPDMPASKAPYIRFNVLDLTPEVVDYACWDAVGALELHYKNEPRILGTPLERVYRLEMAIVDVVSDMEDRGVSVDFPSMVKALAWVESFVLKMEEEVRARFTAWSGKDQSALKFNSPKAMADLLYGQLGLTTTRMTKAGAMSTDAVALLSLSKKHPEVRELLDYREVLNMKNRLSLWLEEDQKKHPRVRGSDGKVHANYNQVRVGTGRFAANDPPIQQCPKEWFWAIGESRRVYEEKLKKGAKASEAVQAARDVDDRLERFEGNFRDFLIASPGCYLLGFDYSQIELRVMAGLAQEKSLLDAFNNHLDVHTITAAKMLGKQPEDVDPKTERPIGKTMNFALLYGMGAGTMADRLGIPMAKAKELHANYFLQFASISSWMSKMKEVGKQRGYTTSWIGRKWTIQELMSSSPAMFAKGERMLVNAPVQGGAADYVKYAMVRARNALKKEGWWNTKVWMLMNQHDALTFEVDMSLDPAKVRALLDPIVTFDPGESFQFPVIEADWEFGYAWGSCVRVDGDTEYFMDGDMWAILGEGGEPVEGWDDDDVSEPGSYEVPTLGDEPADVFVEAVQPEILEAVVPLIPTPQTTLMAGPGKELLVTLTRMPTEELFLKFVEEAQASPGANSIVLQTPEGNLELNFTTGLTVKDAGSISTWIGGAQVSYAESSVDTDSLAVGLNL